MTGVRGVRVGELDVCRVVLGVGGQDDARGVGTYFPVQERTARHEDATVREQRDAGVRACPLEQADLPPRRLHGVEPVDAREGDPVAVHATDRERTPVAEGDEPEARADGRQPGHDPPRAGPGIADRRPSAVTVHEEDVAVREEDVACAPAPMLGVGVVERDAPVERPRRRHRRKGGLGGHPRGGSDRRRGCGRRRRGGHPRRSLGGRTRPGLGRERGPLRFRRGLDRGVPRCSAPGVTPPAPQAASRTAMAARQAKFARIAVILQPLRLVPSSACRAPYRPGTNRTALASPVGWSCVSQSVPPNVMVSL